MKTKIFIFTVILSLGMVFQGCEKEEDIQAPQNNSNSTTVQKELKTQQKANYSSIEAFCISTDIDIISANGGGTYVVDFHNGNSYDLSINVISDDEIEVDIIYNINAENRDETYYFSHNNQEVIITDNLTSFSETETYSHFEGILNYNTEERNAVLAVALQHDLSPNDTYDNTNQPSEELRMIGCLSLGRNSAGCSGAAFRAYANALCGQATGATISNMNTSCLYDNHFCITTVTYSC